jgi:transposase
MPCRPVTHSRRRIVDAILYVARTGCAWRQLPHDFPSWKTVYWYFTRWNSNGTLDHLHNALREKVRIAEGRNAEPTAGIVDAQSIRGADTVGKESRGYDAGKKINGRKRSIVVDTIGMLLIAVVTAANVQDRDGGNLVIAQLHKIMPSVRCIWADGGYAGLLVRWARMATAIALEIVRKHHGQKTFEVLPRRWVVERTFALADALAAPALRLRTIDGGFGSDDEVGHGGTHDKATCAVIGTSTVERSTCRMTFPDTFLKVLGRHVRCQL